MAIAEVQPIEASEYETERGKPMPSVNHSQAQFNCLLSLASYRERFSIHPELAIQMPGWDKPLIPDICILPKRPINWSHDRISEMEAPLTAIEILSPTQGSQAISEKLERYFEAGVKSCWVIEPFLRYVTIFVPGADPQGASKGTLTDHATGIEIDVDAIFAV